MAIQSFTVPRSTLLFFSWILHSLCANNVQGQLVVSLPTDEERHVSSLISSSISSVRGSHKVKSIPAKRDWKLKNEMQEAQTNLALIDKKHNDRRFQQTVDSIRNERSRFLNVLNLDDHDMNQCYINLSNADMVTGDGNSFLSQDEYLQFIYVQSERVVNAATAPTFSDLDWELQTIFIHSTRIPGADIIDLTTDDLDKLQTTVIYVCEGVLDWVAPFLPSYSPSVAPPMQPSGSSTTGSPLSAPIPVPASPRPLNVLNLDDNAMNQCYINLSNADMVTGDDNSFLSQDEYLQFIYVQSEGVVNAATAPTFFNLDWELQTFFMNAILTPGADIIDLTTDDLDKLQTTVVYVCGSVLEWVAPFLPSYSPSVAPSMQPSGSPTTGSPLSAPIPVPASPRPTDKPVQSQQSSPQPQSNATSNEDKNIASVDNNVNNDDDDFRVGLLVAIVVILVAAIALMALLLNRKKQQELQAQEEQRIKSLSFDRGAAPASTAQRSLGVEAVVPPPASPQADSSARGTTLMSDVIPGTADDPPQQGWVESKDALGRASYYHKQTGEVTWTRPQGLVIS
ncbi:hypothetical protein ACA910_010557 [Epithemia clementina (nom. ined.)]